MLSFTYPPVGFHFVVVFELFPQGPNDARFQEVSGLNVEMETETFKEAGNNRFSWQLPVRTRFDDITLKRGIVMGSGVTLWMKDALENFIFNPCNAMISLLTEDHIPLYNWYVVNVIPKKWQVSSFNAQESSIAIETLVLSYQYFNTIRV